MTVHSAAEFGNAVWRKSSRSNGNGGSNCVEVAIADVTVGVRDSKDPGGPVLCFTPAAWAMFVDSASRDGFAPAG